MSILLRLISGLTVVCIHSCMYSGTEMVFGVSFKALIGIFIVSLMVYRVCDELEHEKYHFRNWID